MHGLMTHKHTSALEHARAHAHTCTHVRTHAHMTCALHLSALQVRLGILG